MMMIIIMMMTTRSVRSLLFLKMHIQFKNNKDEIPVNVVLLTAS